MRTLLICHHDNPFVLEGFPLWLNSFSDLAGIVIIREERERVQQRIKREVARVGAVRFLDVAAFRVYYKLLLAQKDKRWIEEKLAAFRSKYPTIAKEVPTFETGSPNTRACAAFIREQRPDIMIAGCKSILKKRIYSIPKTATVALHPGICPNYRNAHGCFWALAKNDLDNVGMSIVKIDAGIDTGDIIAHLSADYDEIHDTHLIVQRRQVVDNFERIQDKFTEMCDGVAVPVDTAGRPSAEWGQPWLSSYVWWKANAWVRQL
jgi:folate-dependent phosphoribosylglycinamide formyltransferase PurN